MSRVSGGRSPPSGASTGHRRVTARGSRLEPYVSVTRLSQRLWRCAARAGFQGRLGSNQLLFTTRAGHAVVARDIVRALERRSPDVLYTPKIWRYIMGAVQQIPENIFKRLSF